jgi:hypothetical protein
MTRRYNSYNLYVFLLVISLKFVNMLLYPFQAKRMLRFEGTIEHICMFYLHYLCRRMGR